VPQAILLEWFVIVMFTRLSNHLTFITQVKEFKQCFDATEVLRPKSDMNTYPVNQIAPRDLVMLELYMTRFKVKKPNETKKPPTWIDWQAQFELRSVNLIGKSNHQEVEATSDVYV
jgi:hypothetical protein